MSSIKINSELLDRFILAVKNRFPKKSFGYFTSNEPEGIANNFILFENDIRNDWRNLFEKYGNYYKRNDDAGFLATPEETYKIEKYIKQKNLFKVGLFHSHQRHPAIFSKVDIDLHPEKNLWHLIISLRNFDIPQIRVFSIKTGILQEIPIILV